MTAVPDGPWSANWSGDLPISPVQAERIALLYTLLVEAHQQAAASQMETLLGMMGLGFAPLSTEDEGYYLTRSEEERP